ncbi:molybdopterin-binding protein [Pseudorhodoplanes sp.]|uniref:molybdopterin-binding protein n=1 Tax=Pseudorhodoplanes sp. TaxID=1934341 RepID=UPI00391AECFD
MVDYDLLGKTELSIHGIVLQNADLGGVADVVAQVLGLHRSDVLVTDVRGEHLVLDILQKGLDPSKLVGREKDLFIALSALPGVSLRPDARTDSRGLLSWVAADPAIAREGLDEAAGMAGDLQERLGRLVTVFATGTEINNGQVKDTNSPAIRERLESNGYAVSLGGTLRDDEHFIAGRIRERAEEGFSLIVTTGGVGAEVKDKTIEALLLLDPDAATPTIVKYELGVGRHVHKNEVRIGVARVLDATVVALPGPTDEVLLGLGALLKALAESERNKVALAERIASVLRTRLQEKVHAHH